MKNCTRHQQIMELMQWIEEMKADNKLYLQAGAMDSRTRKVNNSELERILD